jgi:hypothetical protein
MPKLSPREDKEEEGEKQLDIKELNDTNVDVEQRRVTIDTNY